jgi:FkbM family methyltransferase
LGLKQQIAGVLTSPAVGRRIQRTRSTVNHHQIPINIDESVVHPSLAAALFWGLYEKTETKFIRQFLGGTSTVVELGASLGVTGAHILSIMDPAGKYVAAEANPALAGHLLGRLGPHIRSQEVHVVSAAIVSDDGLVEFTISEDTLASSLNGEGMSTEVCGITLRSLLTAYDIQTFSLVADIEGAVPHILLADPGVLDDCELMIVELEEASWEGCRLTSREQRGAALRLGFREVASHGPVIVFRR